MTTTTLDSQRFQRIHLPSVGNIYIRGETTPVSMTLSCRQPDHPGVSPLRPLDRWWRGRAGTRTAVACRTMLTAGLLLIQALE